MKLLILTVLMTLLISGLNSLEKKEIPVNIIHNKVVVSLKIGNVTIPDIMLDTGMHYDGILIYNPAYKDTLDLLQAINVNIGGAGSGKASRALMVDSTDVFLESIKLKSQRIILFDNDLYKDFPTNGVIGYSLFGQYSVLIDYDRKIMELAEPEKLVIDSSWTSIPLYFKENSIPWLDLSLQVDDEPNIPISAYIDLADGDNIVILEKPEVKVKLPKETIDVVLGTGLCGEVSGKKGTISKLFIAHFELDNIEASFARTENRSRQSNADAILGSGILHRFNLIFDYLHKKLYLKPNKSYKE